MISETLFNALIAFRRERDWEQFHTIRNLSTALCVESAELLALFRWAHDSDIPSVVDVTILLMYLYHDLGISIEDTIRKKLEVNRQRYPVESSKGVSTKYDRLK
jgi:NTP pyrophosphatase (non-canonical NTP hydrolase)